MASRRGFAFTLVAAIALVAVPSTAGAALGGSVGTVEADRVSMQGALMRMVRSDSFQFHEIRSATGTLVREYVSPSGTVFGVAWQGPWLPDLRQVLGDEHFEQLQRSMRQAARARRIHGVVIVEEPNLVVRMSGHPRSFYGIAYLPGQLPPGVRAEAIR
jgi:hypothetical protein